MNEESFPTRMEPHVILSALNEPVEISTGSFRLASPSGGSGTLTGVVKFRWSPSTALEFEGDYSGPDVNLGTSDLVLGVDGLGGDVPVLLTRVSKGSKPTHLGGIIRGAHVVGRHDDFNRFRFCLVNFPKYIGTPIKYNRDGVRSVCTGRLLLGSENLQCIVDELCETAHLRRQAKQEGGYFISHVGELRCLGTSNPHSAQNLHDFLHFFFGFLRGAWAGPVFPYGYRDQDKTWELVASWTLGEDEDVPTWLPTSSRLALGDLFSQFSRVWLDPEWQAPLRTAIAWYVTANAKRVPHETRIILAQVALELLAWVVVVEKRAVVSRRRFDRSGASERIRKLFELLNIPTDVPAHFTTLQTLRQEVSDDGPGVVVRVRNALVHASENSRDYVENLSGEQLWESGQLALQYIELVLLAIFGYRGLHARRAWRGWKGDDEVPVPWA